MILVVFIETFFIHRFVLSRSPVKQGATATSPFRKSFDSMVGIVTQARTRDTFSSDSSTARKNVCTDKVAGVSGKNECKRCDLCSKTFSTKSKLIIHKRSHSGEKPFVCNVCEKPFSQKPHLQRHYLLHTSQKPFKCKVCGHKCRQKSNLKQHYVTVHLLR